MIRRRHCSSAERFVNSALLLFLSVLFLCPGMSLPAAAQQKSPEARGRADVHTVVTPTQENPFTLAPAVAEPLREIPMMPTPEVHVPGSAAPKFGATDTSTTAPSAAPLAPVAAAPSPISAASFEALGDDNSVIPPDTQGAVGLNHLMVTENNGVRIQTRTGAVISTVTLASFWASTGATGIFDPRVTYDPYNNRWIFVSLSDARTAASSLLLGVSHSSDPTGTWSLYRFDVDAANVNWGDYPSIGFNKNWIVVSCNIFTISTSGFVRSNVYVFNKADLYAGGTGTFSLFTDTAAAATPAATYDNTISSLYLVQNWINNDGVGNGSLRLSTITGGVGSEVFTTGAAFPTVAAPWAVSAPAGADFAPQLNSLRKIQTGDTRILNVVYRNGSIWASHTAFLPVALPTRSAAQWWQFTPSGAVQQFGRIEDPNGLVFYAFPTIAVNTRNDVLVGYSSFSSTQYASAGYSFHAASDLPNTMRADTILKAGEAPYYKILTGLKNRWGDYSNTVVDPINDLDMWTIQEYASSPNFVNGNNRWGTWWGKVSLTVRDDFDGDGKADILWRNSSTGDNVIWLMNGAAIASGALFSNVAGPNWHFAGIGDFNGDGKADILWRNSSTGDNVMWLMNGSSIAAGTLFSNVADPSWQIAGTSDFDGDGKADILWRNSTTGDNVIWLMNGSSIAAGALFSTVTDPSWQIAGVADFDGDGKADILWRNSVTGDNVVWLMNGTSVAGGALFSNVGVLNWKIVGIGDFNGDGKADILWRNSSTGDNVIWFMNGASIASSTLFSNVATVNWQIAEIRDFNGDGNADILWRNTSTGQDVIWLMNGATIAGGGTFATVTDLNWQIF